MEQKNREHKLLLDKQEMIESSVGLYNAASSRTHVSVLMWSKPTELLPEKCFSPFNTAWN